jgi:outer membrane protein assembly factor BamA
MQVAGFSGKTITRVDINDDQGKPWSRPEQILPLTLVKPGVVFSGAAIRDGISLLYLKGLFKDIRVDAFPDDGGVRLEYTLFPITVVEKTVIQGRPPLTL